MGWIEILDQADHPELWEIWEYSDDPDLGETCDIGYITDSGTGRVVASSVEKTDASLIVAAVRILVAGRAR